MKILLFFILVLGSSSLFSQEELSEIKDNMLSSYLNAEKFGVDNYILIPYSINKNKYRLEAVGRSNSAKNIIIDAEKLVAGNKVLKFNEQLNTEKPDEGIFLKTEYDFLQLGNMSLKIIFSNFDSNKVELKNKGETLFLVLDDEKLKTLNGSLTLTTLFSKKMEQVDLDKKISEISDLKKTIDQIKDCVEKKDLECLIKYQDVSERTRTKENEKELKSTLLNKYKESFIRRTIFETDEMCEIYNQSRYQNIDGDKHIPKELKGKINSSFQVAWESLAKALSLDLNYDYVTLAGSTLSNGYDQVTIFKRYRKKVRCGNYVEARFVLKKIKDAWRIQDFNVEN
jgi:hypothetical protein